MSRARGGWAWSLLLLVAGMAGAQSQQAGDGITIHYHAQPTLTLTPEVARGYAITRSASRALLNVALRRARPDGLADAVAAKVEGAATNLAGQRQALGLREVREGDAIYYLAEPRIGARDTLDFELRIIPDGAATPVLVRFRQEFFPVVR